jgi:hypothetical protein
LPFDTEHETWVCTLCRGYECDFPGCDPVRDAEWLTRHWNTRPSCRFDAAAGKLVPVDLSKTPCPSEVAEAALARWCAPEYRALLGRIAARDGLSSEMGRTFARWDSSEYEDLLMAAFARAKQPGDG